MTISCKENSESDDIFSSWLFDTFSNDLPEEMQMVDENPDAKRLKTVSSRSLMMSPASILPSHHPSFTFPPNAMPMNIGDTIVKNKKDERKRRLEKNRVSARISRMKKKNEVNELQLRVAALEKENLELRLKLEQNTTERANEREETKQLTAELIDMLKNNASDDQLSKAMWRFAEMYADYGKNRQDKLKHHLNQVRRVYDADTSDENGALVLATRR